MPLRLRPTTGATDGCTGRVRDVCIGSPSALTVRALLGERSGTGWPEGRPSIAWSDFRKCLVASGPSRVPHEPFPASNTTLGLTARPLGAPLAALVLSRPGALRSTSHFHPATQHNGFSEKLCCNPFLLLWRLCCVAGTPPAVVSGHLNFLGALSDPRAGRGQDVQKAGARHRHGTGAASQTHGGRLFLE